MKIKALSYPVSLGSFELQEKLIRFKRAAARFFSSTFKVKRLSNLSPQATSKSVRQRYFSRLPYKKITRYIIIAGLVALVTFVGGRIVKGLGSTAGNGARIAGAKAVEDISREFAFPLRNGNGEEVSKIKFTIEKAELRDEIVIQGQRATAIKGRIFLILTLKVKNEHNQAIEIDTRDYIRLSVNGNGEEWLAPDIHNDPVEVQAISTKFTRVGFPINDSDRALVLRVGEIGGEKEMIALNLE